ncbi:MAG: DUF1761 domain-containing protein [Bacteroidia bacterium]
MQPNFLIVLLAALVPMALGFIWYNPKVFGKAWMAAAEITEDKMKGANMAVIFIVSFLLSYLLAFNMQFITIHQWGVFSMLATDPKAMGDATQGNGKVFADLMAQYGANFRTFKHGALHGTLAGILIATPILGTNALFERKGFKYIAVNCGYWIVCMALMGGIVCQFA